MMLNPQPRWPASVLERVRIARSLSLSLSLRLKRKPLRAKKKRLHRRNQTRRLRVLQWMMRWLRRWRDRAKWKHQSLLVHL